MDEYEAGQLHNQIVAAHPDAQQVEGKLIWHPSEGVSTHVGVYWADPAETKLALEVLQVLPPIFHLQLDRAIEKKLKKLNSKMLQPRGFSLVYSQGEFGLLTGLQKQLSPEVKTIEQFKEFETELQMLTMVIFFGISDFESNKW